MKRNQTKEYIIEISLVLYNFQLIEQALKSYICVAIEKIKERTKDVIPYKYNRKWVNNDTLGKLIKKFEKINDNKELIKEIKRLTPYRNKVAHQGLLISVDEWNNSFQMAIQTAQLGSLRDETRKVLSQILKETKIIENNYYQIASH